MKKNKFKLLRQGLLYDAIGFGSMLIPFLGWVFDLFWAPFAAKKMNDMYEGTSGKIATAIVFLEEILLFDFIPTFTLMWLYTYVFNTETKPVPQTLEVKINE
ncbi:MAG: hypothetical protein R2781_03355 [Flavobacteriaceae bacterium]